jgi:histidine triad (HIT) family protein
MNDCIFCKIIKGEIPSKTIYEDEKIKIFMNINPSTDGHLLVVPKEHLVTIMDVSNELISYALDIVRENIYPLLKERLHCEGLTLAQNNDLGQEIKHYHIHLIPRYPEDGADFQYDKSKVSDLDTVFENLTK